MESQINIAPPSGIMKSRFKLNQGLSPTLKSRVNNSSSKDVHSTEKRKGTKSGPRVKVEMCGEKAAANNSVDRKNYIHDTL